MKRLIFLGVVLCMAVATAVFVGCSDDTTNPVLQEGDTLDPTFIAFKEGFDGAEQYTPTILNMIFLLADSVLHNPDNPNSKPAVLPTSQGIQADSFLFVYHESSQYWYFYVSRATGSDTTRLIDSIQFLHGTSPVQWPDSALLSGLKTGLSLYLRLGDGLLTATQEITLLGDFPNFGVLTANGNQHLNLSLIDNHVPINDDSMYCEYALNFSATFNDVVFTLIGMESGCPTSGNIVYTGAGSVDCTGDSATVAYSGSWKVTQTFEGTTITYVFENATTRWTLVEDCNYGVTKPTLFGSKPSLLGEIR